MEQAKELIGGIADTDKLWFYGYRKKAIIYTIDNILYKTVSMIRRLAKVDSNGHIEYIYLYPSLALKRCPFSLNTIDQLYTENVPKGADPLDNIDDPQNILECSDRADNFKLSCARLNIRISYATPYYPEGKAA